MPLDIKQEVVEQWVSIAEERLPIQPFIFDKQHYSLKVLNQLLLPATKVYVPVEGVEDAHRVIQRMIVRGAPLIATVGMLGLLVDLYQKKSIDRLHSAEELLNEVHSKCDLLVDARPTAINLRNAVDGLKKFALKSLSGHDRIAIRDRIRDYILQWQAAERKENDLLIMNSISVLAALDPGKKQLSVMTICNTGALATSSFGTALGVIVHLHKLGMLARAIALETRPYNQGSRLTALELMESNVPFDLITDSMAAYAMKTHRIDAVLVGADQVASNGDTANKIGTYGLAILANFHRIPFYVVTPTSSVNPQIGSCAEIPIEYRPPEELLTFNGSPSAPAGCTAWNPAFDVTPADLITGLLTELGCFQPHELEEAIHTGSAKLTGKLPSGAK